MPSIDPRTGPAEVGRAVEREDLAARGPRRSSPNHGRSARPRAHSSTVSASVEAARHQHQHLRVDVARPRPRSSRPTARHRRPSRSQPPARRTCSGTQWPDGERRVEPLEADDARRRAGRRRAARDTRPRRAPRRSRRRLDQVDGGVLGLGHRADRRDRVEDALDRRRLERDDRDVGVDRAGDLVDLAVADRADAAQLLGQDQVGLGGRERLLVERVQRRAAVDRRRRRRRWISRDERVAQVVDAAGHDRLADRPRRAVALVGDADELVAEAEGADDLGRRREEGDDAHRMWSATLSGDRPRARGRGRAREAISRGLRRVWPRRRRRARPPCP